MFRFCHRFCIYWGTFATQVRSPYSFWGLLCVVISGFVALYFGDFMTQMDNIHQALISFLIILPVWILGNLVICLWKFRSREDAEGIWDSNKFIYHTPPHVMTLQLKSEENGRKIRFKVRGIPSGCFVDFKVDYDGGHGFVIIYNHEKTVMQSAREADYGVELNKKREAVLEMCVPSNSRETICKIYIKSFRKRSETLMTFSNINGVDFHVKKPNA